MVIFAFEKINGYMRLRNIFLLALMLLLASCGTKKAVQQAQYPKREFRGAWIQAVNGQFSGMDEKQMKEYLVEMLDNLEKVNVNAVLFQVRVEGDALYPSEIEPWSRFLTGVQGRSPGWDPLAFMVSECHKRNMELHAWINPYRARTKGTKYVAPSHLSSRKPGNCVEFEGQLYFNPALQSNRDHICKVVTDIITRYDVDGLHIDDYFYPYPVKGKEFKDDKQFPKEGYDSKGDWRRENVNHLIYQLHRTVRELKPWVKFGVSPFGIYRNKKNSQIGSETNGLQNYDDLYADVLLWINKGWVDYSIPQIYWQIGHSAADYKTLIKWWNQYASARPLYIGEDVERTVKYPDPNKPERHQQVAKYTLHQGLENVDGAVLWYAKAAVDNPSNYSTMLRKVFWRYPSLQPSMPFIDDKNPAKVRSIKPVWVEDGYMLFWTAPKGKGWQDEAVKYVVYRFGKGEKVNIDDPSKIVAITHKTYYPLPYVNGKTKYTYVVTALDRMQNER